MVVADNTLGATRRASHSTSSADSGPRGVLHAVPVRVAEYRLLARRRKSHLPDLREDCGEHRPRLDRQHLESVFHGSSGHREILLHGFGRRFRDACEINEQTAMRHFDIANRDRTRSSLILQVTPLRRSGSTPAWRRARRLQRVASAFVTTRTTALAGFNRCERFDQLRRGCVRSAAIQWSRTSNPLPSPSFDDPSRDWGIDSSDKVDTVTANLDFIKIIPKPISASASTSAMASRRPDLGPNSTVPPASTTDRKCSTPSRSCSSRPPDEDHDGPRGSAFRSGQRRARRRLLKAYRSEDFSLNGTDQSAEPSWPFCLVTTIVPTRVRRCGCGCRISGKPFAVAVRRSPFAVREWRFSCRISDTPTAPAQERSEIRPASALPLP
jgi:hypothetical protein